MPGRRQFLAAGSALAAATFIAPLSKALAATPDTISFGFQKTGIPLVARQLKVFEKRFEPRGIKVNWVEFPSGLTLLQALDIGQISFGNSGNVGCIFQQAAGGHIDYIAAQPSGPKSEGILVKATSSIRTLADLRGKKVGYAKGSSSHDLIAAALEKAGVKLADIDSISLGAADAAFAYDSGDTDAWVIWDPYFTIAQKRTPSRVLAYTGDIKPSSGFLLANSGFAAAYPELVREYIDGSKEAAAWAKSHPAEVTSALSAATGIPADVMALVTQNASFDVTALSTPLLDAQQNTADRLYALGLIPKKVNVRDIVWKSNT
ncbi:sulfonate transport system substrate-binding protein [Paraburkholderia fungorum]|uniref:Putative aliphatic sulfonates-binding protein n=1 Tax=Paraburkholderia fungorum TaxID=134537 RepID=A0A1H1JF30_9BURK|nr:aliphatic sulfonate ABC transporter substrate-binding protein [Paraburkholderia fungorum]SDR48350.1 sulfonate transport system substrate-binding protein [Paraburkholderia fungorum]